MTDIRKNRNPLTDRPIKTSQSTGAALASMGIANAIPLMHGSQGCGAFAKVYLIQHFREPMPIQNTGMDQISSVLGGDSNLTDAMKLLCDKNSPDLINIMSTGLTELQGTDLQRIVKDFRKDFPEYHTTEIVAAATPDFTGSAQSGFAAMIEQIVKSITVTGPGIQKISNKLAIICSMALTPADAEYLEMLASMFGFDVTLLPDLSDSLDGHLADEDFSATSTGGTSVEAIKALLQNRAIVLIGESLSSLDSWLQNQGADTRMFPHLMGLSQSDNLIRYLADLSGKQVPASVKKARKRYLDTLLDAHFYISDASIATALEPDLTLGYSALFEDIGLIHKRAVTTMPSPGLKQIKCEDIVIGDHSDLDDLTQSVDLMIGNTHCAGFFDKYVPVYRAGYPCHDRLGTADQLQVGYGGGRASIIALTNLVLARQEHEVEAYTSPYQFDFVLPAKV